MDKQHVSPEEYKKIAEEAEEKALKEFSKKTLVGAENLQGGVSPQVIRAVDCVDQSHLLENVAENLKLIDTWINGRYKAHSKKVVLASAGPSLENHIEEIKERQKRGDWVVAVKHSLPRLMDAGITPDAVVALDPRDIEGTSTHNKKRKDLFASADFSKTIFFVASITSPTVTKFLQSKDAMIVGWHATIKEIHEQFKYHINFSIAGGSCSAMRAISLLDILGFKHITLAGLDSSLDKDPEDLYEMDPDGRPKYMEVTVGDEKYLSTGELAAQIQDLERWFMNQFDWDVTLEVLPGGLCEKLYREHSKGKKLRKFDDLINGVLKHEKDKA